MFWIFHQNTNLLNTEIPYEEWMIEMHVLSKHYKYNYVHNGQKFTGNKYQISRRSTAKKDLRFTSKADIENWKKKRWRAKSDLLTVNERLDDCPLDRSRTTCSLLGGRMVGSAVCCDRLLTISWRWPISCNMSTSRIYKANRGYHMALLQHVHYIAYVESS